MLLKWCNALKFGSTAFFLQRENYVAAYFVYVAFCVSYAFISGALVAFLSPAATGGGIPCRTATLCRMGVILGSHSRYLRFSLICDI